MNEKPLSLSTHKQAKLDSLIAQCNRLGCRITSGCFRGGWSSHTGNGLYAAKRLKKGQLLFSHDLNGESLFNLSTIMANKSKHCNSKGKEAVENDGNEGKDLMKLHSTLLNILKLSLKSETFNIDDFFGTTIALMVDTPFASSSHLGSYIEWLPNCYPLAVASRMQELDSPMLWNPDELVFLKNTSVYRKLREFEESSLEKFGEYILSCKPLCDYFDAVGLTLETDKWLYFKHCACVVQSYSFTINPDEDEDSDAVSSVNTMIPLMDAFNASNSLQNVHLLIDAKSQTLECRTTSSVKAGDELFNTFGIMDAGDRIIKYGYMESSDEYPLMFNMQDFVDMLDGASWRKILLQMLPRLFEKYDNKGTEKKRKLQSESATLTDTVSSSNGPGINIVAAVKREWLRSEYFEEFFPPDNFKKPIDSYACLFSLEDFIEGNDGNYSESDSDSGDDVHDTADFDVDSNSESDPECEDSGSSDSNVDNEDYANLDTTTDTLLADYDVFAFLNSIVEMSFRDEGKNISKQHKKKKVAGVGVYHATMMLYHFLIKSRYHRFAFDLEFISDQNNQEQKSPATSRRCNLCETVIARENRILKKHLVWSREWLMNELSSSTLGCDIHLLGSPIFVEDALQ